MRSTRFKGLDKLTSPPQHTSYLTHRRQVLWQVILPVVLGALLLVAVIVLLSMAAVGGTGDLSRWAAISTMWLVIPVTLAGLLVLVVLIALNYLTARILHVIPTYTGIVQDYAYRLAGVVRRFTKAAVRPIFFLDELTTKAKAYLGRR